MPEAEGAVGAVSYYDKLYKSLLCCSRLAVLQYIIPWVRIWQPDPRSKNKELQGELKQYLDEQIRLFENTGNPNNNEALI